MVLSGQPEFSYEPDSFRYGALISLAGVASLLALRAWTLLARKGASMRA